MTALVGALIGGSIGLGLLVIVAGVTGRPLVEPRVARPSGVTLAVFSRGLGAAVLAYWLTSWPVVAVGVAIAAVAAPAYLGGGARHRRELARVEAIASWTEHLRDTIAGANGLEHAIAASAGVAPSALAPEVQRLAAQLGYVALPTALRSFADEVDHPNCDFVVAGLSLASQKEARELGPLLGQLAGSARAEAQMRSRVWAGRARTRTSVRVIGAAVLLFALGLVIFDRGYLEPYGSLSGQLVLAAVVAIFAASLVAMDRMSRIRLPERFIGRRRAGEAP